MMTAIPGSTSARAERNCTRFIGFQESWATLVFTPWLYVDAFVLYLNKVEGIAVTDTTG